MSPTTCQVDVEDFLRKPYRFSFPSSVSFLLFEIRLLTLFWPSIYMTNIPNCLWLVSCLHVAEEDLSVLIMYIYLCQLINDIIITRNFECIFFFFYSYLKYLNGEPTAATMYLWRSKMRNQDIQK